MSAAGGKLAQDSLAFALGGAARALAMVDAGTALPKALSASFGATRATPSARGAIQDICYRSMRCWGMSKALMAAMVEKAPQQAQLGTLICTALGLLADASRPYADHTIVDQAVAACAADRELARAKGVVNAVLRRFLRERQALMARVLEDEQARWNYPQWWIDKARKDYPHDWQRLLEAGNAHPPLTLRVNRRKISAEDYLGQLARAGIEATLIGPAAIRLTKPVPVTEIPGFGDGWVSVQDAGAQLAAPLMDLNSGMRVLDACAAPGGKSGHMLETADIDLLALDQDAERLERVAQNLQRLQLSAELRQGDARERGWWDGQPFDRILVDVPCTASGIVRRHPDIRWLRRPSDAADLARLAADILDNLWSMLRPGGKLLLVTCSVWPEESTRQADSFAARHQAIRLPAPGQLLPAHDGQQGNSDHDGLFYALLQKPAV